MPAYPTADESRNRLVLAGWTVSETGTASTWLVFGVHGEHRIEAQAPTRDEAWHLACEKAKALGLLAEG